MSATDAQIHSALDDLALSIDEAQVDRFKGAMWKDAVAKLTSKYGIDHEGVFVAIENEFRAEWPRIVASGAEAAIQEALNEFRSEARAILKQS